MGDGLLPDLQAEIKTSCKPGVIDMYYQINRMTCLVALVWATVTLQMTEITRFIVEHGELRRDLLLFSVLNAVGQLVIYQLIKLFKQHIAPFVIATRKCITVIVNIVHFGHSVNGRQIAGMVLVFTAIMLEVLESYKKKGKEGGTNEVQMNELPQSEAVDADQENVPSSEESALNDEIKTYFDGSETVSK